MKHEKQIFLDNGDKDVITSFLAGSVSCALDEFFVYGDMAATRNYTILFVGSVGCV